MNIKLNEGTIYVKIIKFFLQKWWLLSYVALTLSLSFFSFGVVQYLIAEGLTILPYIVSFSI